MRRLFLIRHAKAQPPTAGEDYDRPLARRGREDASRIAIALADRNMLPAVLIHSGAARAKETAEILASEWDNAVRIEEEIGLYDAPQDVLFERAQALRDNEERVALVGHNPGLGELALSLAGSGSHLALKRMHLKFPTCTVAALDFDVENWRDIEHKSAKLALFLSPSELEEPG
jgi:phosphohistidine phosphatase